MRHTTRAPVRPTKQVFIGVSVKRRMIGRQSLVGSTTDNLSRTVNSLRHCDFCGVPQNEPQMSLRSAPQGYSAAFVARVSTTAMF
jgi:hypothetical protein